MAPTLKGAKACIRTCLREMRRHDDALMLHDSLEGLALFELETRYNDVEPNFDKLKKSLALITELVEGEDDEEEEINLASDLVAEGETVYFKICGRLKTELNRRQPPPAEVPENAPRQPHQHRDDHIIKGPRLEVPTFDGSPEKWIKFRDMFEEMIHNHAKYTPMMKFQFLENAMKIPAHETNVLANFPLSANNYEAAWAAVCDRYDDINKLVELHLHNMVNVKIMKEESAAEVRRIMDTFSSNICALHQLGFDLSKREDFANRTVAYLVTTKLEPATLREWKKFIKKDCVTWQTLLEFLTVTWHSLDEVKLTKAALSRPANLKPTDTAGTSKASKTFAASSSSPPKSNNSYGKPAPTGSACVVCSKTHALWHCEKFKAMGTKERREVVTKHMLCFNCFSRKHAVAGCPSTHRCRTCCKMHNTLLHLDGPGASAVGSSFQPSNFGANGLSPTAPLFEAGTFNRKASGDQHYSAAAMSRTFVANCRTLLSTVVVMVADRDGNWLPCRTLLDTGSDASYVTGSYARRLKLPLEDVCRTVEGLNGNITVINHQLKTSVYSRYTSYAKELEFWVLPVIASNLPSQPVDLDVANIPKGYFLADPNFHESQPVDMLLQSSVFFDALRDGKIRLPNGLIFLETEFGWIIGGTLDTATRQSSLLACMSLRTQTIGMKVDEKLDRFFKQEEMEPSQAQLTAEEKFCEQVFKTTTERAVDGRYVVQMPFKSNVHKLGVNMSNALKALRWQEDRRQKNPDYNDRYVAYMEDYIKSGRMSEVEPPAQGDVIHYLPHHGVLKLTSSTTKLRPVFNASSKSETGLSLNDVLCVGRIVQPESFDIMMRFREHKYIITADITKMYLQIWVHPSQRDYMRILWRSDVNGPIKHYRLNTVTFGTAPAPGLATRVLLQQALDNEVRFPAAAAVIKNSFYVDDTCFGVNDVDEGRQIRDQIRTILEEAGLPLCKFASNNPELLVGLPANAIESSAEENSITKTLGIVYDTTTDQFSFRLKPMKEGRITKTSVLSEIASIYDMYGWIGPVILHAKLFMKKLWKLKLGWKDLLPADLQLEWNEFRQNFHLLNDIKLNRRCFIDNHVLVELHGFSDASIVGYGAVIYAYSVDQIGHTQVSIICAKSRVAPESQKTLARLELCGATLLAILGRRAAAIFSAPIDQVTMWCDSTIVLSWITLPPASLQVFVGNRVAEIQELTAAFQWKHIPGVDNPADIISRGLSPADIASCELWWNGPAFFSQPQSKWPEPIITLSTDDPEVSSEMKKCLTLHALSNDTFTEFETEFTSAKELIRDVAQRMRVTDGRISDEILSMEELEKAEMTIIKVIQQKLFANEYATLMKLSAHHVAADGDKGPAPQLSKKSQLLPLAPFLDANEVIRVTGRLEHCPDLTWEQKHPIILPDCNFTRNLIRELHETHFHPTQRALLAFVRDRYWPLRAKRLIRTVTRRCLTCFRVKPASTHQFMADLPAARVTITHAFTSTAVDYAGFFLIRTSLARKSSSSKVYIAMFKCMCTGAIHLELVTDLTSQAFIAALDRFISRRGLCHDLFSDNGTCFVAADKELKRIVAEMDTDVHEHCINRSIKWRFTTPLAPHAGGIYESGIKTVKHHLKRVMGTELRTYEQFTTILHKIEALVNSRPLTPMTDDPSDLHVLTPGHFLIGRSLITKPERNFVETKESRLDRWEKLQQVQQKFWEEWRQDYLHHLQTRPKNFRQKVDIELGTMVLLHDKHVAPMSWIIGRITALHPGPDGIVRTVTVKTDKGEYDRQVQYISILPMEKDNEDNDFEARQDVR